VATCEWMKMKWSWAKMKMIWVTCRTTSAAFTQCVASRNSLSLKPSFTIAPTANTTPPQQFTPYNRLLQAHLTTIEAVLQQCCPTQCRAYCRCRSLYRTNLPIVSNYQMSHQFTKCSAINVRNRCQFGFIKTRRRTNEADSEVEIL